MSEPLIVVDTSDIRPGRRAQVQRAVRELVAFVEANEPRVLAYHVHLDQEPERMTVLQIHPDPASMELHMKLAAPIFQQFSELLRLRSMDVYGEPSAELLAQLTRKARMLGGAPPALHAARAGFARLRPR